MVSSREVESKVLRMAILKFFYKKKGEMANVMLEIWHNYIIDLAPYQP